jgi:hypothetical protein
MLYKNMHIHNSFHFRIILNALPFFSFTNLDVMLCKEKHMETDGNRKQSKFESEPQRERERHTPECVEVRQ